MKSLPLFKAVDSLSLTPATARRLLHLLVGLFVLCLFCACVLYLWSKVSSGVSCQRRLMNDAASEMRLYFGQRQMLLERLGSLVVRDPALPKRALDPHRQLPRYQRQWVALGEARSAWGVMLSGRDLADLDRLGPACCMSAAANARWSAICMDASNVARCCLTRYWMHWY